MDFSDYVNQWVELYLKALSHDAKSAVGTVATESFAALPLQSQRILVVAPHPDDECLMAGVALRAQKECGAQIGVVAYSFGSDPLRKGPRKQEFKEALQVLGFSEVSREALGLVVDQEWSELELQKALEFFNPDSVLVPARTDRHPTHVRASMRSWAAVRAHVARTQTPIDMLETEYWGQIEAPNLLIPLGVEQVKQMGQALLAHQGEVSRNPYHLSLLAFLMDQQRRGAEVVSGFGRSIEPAIFAQILGHTRVRP